MRILWFANTPANADEFFNSELKGTGGWLKALDKELQSHIELHVAFYSNHPVSFSYGKSTYHPIGFDQSIVKKVRDYFRAEPFGQNDTRKYLEIIKKVNPDLIHIHGTERPYTETIKCMHDIPVVVSIQGVMTLIHHKYSSGYGSDYLKKKNRKLTSIKDFFFPQTYLTNFKKLEKSSIREAQDLKNIKFIMGRTEWDWRITRIFAPNSKYYPDNRILRDSFYNHFWEPKDRCGLVLHTTMDTSFYKGFESICQALNLLNNLSMNVEWRVAGINNSDLIVKLTREKLKKDFPKKGLALLGKINQEVLIESLLNSDAYIMASHIENNANSLCEAMMLGMPCIATFVGGVGSLIKDGEEGILIQAGDPWAMAGAILELANNKEKAIELGKNARKTALERHDKSKITKNIIEVYESIISEFNN